MNRITIPNVGNFEREVLFADPSSSEHVQYHLSLEPFEAISHDVDLCKPVGAFLGGVMSGLASGIILASWLF